jgi:hypothetical protein
MASSERRVRTRAFAARIALLGAFGIGALGIGRGAAAQDVPPPTRFERILWCAVPDSGHAVAKDLGFTAVQLGRGEDPAPLAARGLGWYLDQPIGKGVLELRDEEWRPVAEAYERGRDPAVLVRPGCVAVPDRIAAAAVGVAEQARRAAGRGLLFVALADEPSATRHNAPLDTCRCAHCLVAFRSFAERRYGSIDALNAAFGTHFEAFADVVPLSTDQVRRRELGDLHLPRDLRSFGAWLEFVDAQFADAVLQLARSAQVACPGVPVGLTGLSAPAAFGGVSFDRLVPQLTLVEPYDIGGAVELTRSLAPRAAHRYMTIGPGDAPAGVDLGDWVRMRLSAMACEGLAGVVVWNDRTVAGDDGPSAFGRAVQRGFAELGPVLDACAGAAVVPGAVWVLESAASVRAWWMLDSAADGMTWVRRLASYEATHSTSQAARVGWIRLLQDLGLQPHFVVEDGFAERLLIERPRCVVLPATIALSDRSAQALAAYVRSGGYVLADHSTGLYDEQLLRRDRGALDDVFGVEARSLLWTDLLVREGKSTGRERGLPLAERGLRGRLGQRLDGGDAFLEHAVGKGRAYYLNAPVVAYGAWRLDEQRVEPARELRRRVRSVLQRAGVEPPCDVRGDNLPTCLARVPLRLRDGRRAVAIRLIADDRPDLLQRIRRAGPVSLQIEFPGERRLGVLGGEPLGRDTKFTVPLDPFGLVVLEELR